MSSGTSLPPGTRLGPYEIIAAIGAGGMGQVFRAKDGAAGGLVALKLLRTRPGDAGETQRRFWREVQLSEKLQHPNIVEVRDAGQSEGWLYIAMELLEGEGLHGICFRHAVVPLAEKIDIMLGISAGLAYAHAMGVVHRDIKPSNVVVTAGGRAKLIDFGTSRLTKGDADITARGLIVGSPDYMSPEQAMNGSLDARTDMFSAGSVFYELLTGAKPFQAATVPALLFQLISREPMPVARACPGLPPWLVEIVEMMMAKEPGKRFRDMVEVHAALEAAAWQVPNPAQPPKRDEG